MGDKIIPKFNRTMPKNAKKFFSPESDEAFKKEHPIGYVILVLCGITVLLLPAVIFYLLTQYIYPVPAGLWLIIGIAGGFIFGIGLFNIVAAWIEQYLGHAVTNICILSGIIIMIISSLFAY